MDFQGSRKAGEEAAARAAQGSAADPSPGAPARAPADPRFVTWRPGEPPPIPLDGEPQAPRPERPEPAPPSAPDPLDAFLYRPDEEAPDLPDLGLPERAPAAEPGPSALRELLAFRLGGEEYALEIERVREVLRPPPITEVPRAPAHVLGVVTVRGQVVAVFDPRPRLGLPAAPLPEGAGRLVVVDAGEGPGALRVDAVSAVIRLPRDGVEPCPPGVGAGAGGCVAGIARDRDRLLRVLDLGALLGRGPAGPAARGGGGADGAA